MFDHCFYSVFRFSNHHYYCFAQFDRIHHFQKSCLRELISSHHIYYFLQFLGRFLNRNHLIWRITFGFVNENHQVVRNSRLKLIAEFIIAAVWVIRDCAIKELIQICLPLRGLRLGVILDCPIFDLYLIDPFDQNEDSVIQISPNLNSIKLLHANSYAEFRFFELKKGYLADYLQSHK